MNSDSNLTSVVNSLLAEIECVHQRIDELEQKFQAEQLATQERLNKELLERINRLELYNYRLQTNFIDLARKD